MKITQKTIYLCYFTLCFLTSASYGQLFLQDDFQIKNNVEWYWRADGNQSEPTVHDGLLHLQLNNAIDTQYCNTEIYNPTQPYSLGTQARIRIKASAIHHGSRGWGFWDGSISSIALDYDVAWIMQQGSDRPDDVYNWFLFGSNSDTLYYKQLYDLNGQIDETKWQTYKILWLDEKVMLFLNDELIYETNKRIPDQNMRMDIWLDNRVLNLEYPIDYYHTNAEKSELWVDFVEISGVNGVSIPREIESNILVWDTPNSFPNGERNYLWKQYEINLAKESEALIFITGSAENYNGFDFADELKVVIDDQDYGWNNSYSLNGNELNGKGRSILIPTNLTSGIHNIDIYSHTTPFLRDVIILSNEGGKTLFLENYNEIADSESGLWKTIDFNITGINDFTLVVSGTGGTNQDVRFEINEKDYGWETKNSIVGNDLKSKPTTIIINEILEEGSHQLKIYNRGAAEIYSVAAYVTPKTTNIKKSSQDNGQITLRSNPNPFNISTKLNYLTNKSSHNKIDIYNSLGQKVETLLNKFQPAGEYNLSWNANRHTSGIYFCILKSDNYFRVEKLLLLK